MDAIRVMTVSEAAKVLRVRRVVLEELIRKGKVKAFSAGPKRGTRITMKALEDFIEANTVVPNSKKKPRRR
jgi:excisionase family DNA binding protein